MNHDSLETASILGHTSVEASLPSSGLRNELFSDAEIKLRSQQRANHLGHLIRHLDSLILVQLSTLYYLECSFFRFAIRALPHFVLFSPKSPFRVAVNKKPRYVTSIAIPSALCVLAHLFMAEPHGEEAQRGYLHGGLFVDFVGEAGPISRWRLLFLDTVVILLQLVMLAMVLERRLAKLSLVDTGTGDSGIATGPSPQQDLDAEEQGVRRSQETSRQYAEATVVSNEDIDGHTPGGHEDGHVLDPFYSGQAVIARINLRAAIIYAWAQRTT